MRSERGTPRPRLLAAAALLVALAAGAWHARAARVPPPFDDAWYLENSFRFYHALHAEGPLAFARAYAASFRFKAPLLSVLPLPAYLLLGPSIGAAQAASLLSLAVLALYLYLLGRRWGEEAGCAAVLVALTLPLLFGLSRRFLVEPWLCAAAAAWIHHLLASDGLRRRGHVLALGLWLGAGLLLKSLFPFYVLAPTAGELLRAWREDAPGLRSRLEPALRTVLGIGGGLALTWYAWNLVYVLGYMASASFGGVASHYGRPAVCSLAALAGYCLRLVNDGVSPYYALAALLAAGALLSRAPAGGRRDPLLRAALLWLLPPVLLAACAVNQDTRLLAPCLPAFALLLAGGLAALAPGGRWRAAGLSFFFLFPFGQCALQTFGRGRLPLRPWALLRERTAYSGPPQRGGQWDQGRLAAVAAAACGEGPVAVGAEHPYLNANLLACLSALDGLPTTFMNYGHGETSAERAVARLQDREPSCLILVRGLPEPDRVPGAARLEARLEQMLRRGALPFRAWRELRLAPGLSAVLYRRAGAIRLSGAPS